LGVEETPSPPGRWDSVFNIRFFDRKILQRAVVIGFEKRIFGD
jgi:hypothetical protein